MTNRTYPNEDSRIVFTDLQGIKRKGVYKRELGFQEISDVELPQDGKSYFPEDDIVSWEYEAGDITS